MILLLIVIERNFAEHRRKNSTEHRTSKTIVTVFFFWSYRLSISIVFDQQPWRLVFNFYIKELRDSGTIRFDLLVFDKNRNDRVPDRSSRSHKHRFHWSFKQRWFDLTHRLTSSIETCLLVFHKRQSTRGKHMCCVRLKFQRSLEPSRLIWKQNDEVVDERRLVFQQDVIDRTILEHVGLINQLEIISRGGTSWKINRLGQLRTVN